MAFVAALFGAAPVAHASLSVPTGGPAVAFSGSSTSGTSVPTAVAGFEAAAGGADNGTVAGEQGRGFRHVTWDGIAVDGSDPGSTVIKPGHVVALGRGRLQPWGLQLGPDVAVANDSFASVNPDAAGLFSASIAWAPFNSNQAELHVVAPAGQASTPMPAQTRGLGIVFLNVRSAGTTIRYFNGDIQLGQLSAPAGTTSFAGLLFPNPVVNRVVVTMGTAEIFGLNGTTGGTNPNALVAGDDVVLAEPAPARPAVAATAGVPVPAVLDTFTESAPGATLRATIDWGDGARTAGTIAPGAGGSFVVTGDHAYAQTGSYTALVTVDDFQGASQTTQTDIDVGPRSSAATVACSPSPVAVSATTVCTATVADTGGGPALAPTGSVTFSSPTPAASFPGGSGCMLGPSPTPGTSSCQVRFSPGSLPPGQARLTAAYEGDRAHAGSVATAIVGVRRQRCTLRALTRRLKARGLGVLVTCDARANVQITARATAARRGRLGAVHVQYGSLKAAIAAGRPTVLTIKPGRNVLAVLRAAIHRHQRVALKLALTASSRVTRATTTTRVSAVRIS